VFLHYRHRYVGLTIKQQWTINYRIDVFVVQDNNCDTDPVVL